jgi:uncharacterized protein YjbI with pentapeptide repeats
MVFAKGVAKEDLLELEAAFAEIRVAEITTELPAKDALIDFSNVEFHRYVAFDRYLYANTTNFENASFRARVDFDNSIFIDLSVFTGATFDKVATFVNLTFGGETHFNGVTFRGMARFGSSTFSGLTNFANADFHDSAIFGRLLENEFLDFRVHPSPTKAASFADSFSFAGATFHKRTTFRNVAFTSRNVAFTIGSSLDFQFLRATFEEEAIFAGAKFERNALFRGATFSGKTTFERATFAAEADFTKASFSWPTSFTSATFSGEASFEEATFVNEITFECAVFDRASNFTCAELKRKTSFESAIFDREPPRFFEVKFHQDTNWRGARWPRRPKHKIKAGEFIDAYACLKLEMDRLKKHEDELDFFALELQSRRVLLGKWGWGLPIGLYGVFSDYGRSYLWPLAWLSAVVVIGAWFIWYFDADRTYWEALGLSAGSTFSVFGFRKDFDLAIELRLLGLRCLLPSKLSSAQFSSFSSASASATNSG